MAHILSVDATERPVQAVSVFQSDRAEIRRIIPVELKAGQNEVCISRLPNCLHGDSIRVEGIGKAVIFDVTHSKPASTSSYLDDDSEAVRTEIKDLEKQLASLRAQKNVSDKQVKTLHDYGMSLSAETSNSDKVERFFPLYEQRRRKIRLQLDEMEEQIHEMEVTLEKRKAALRQDDASKKRATKVTVVVFAEEDGPAELSLQYAVTGAAWAPLYDIRARIDSSAPSASTAQGTSKSATPAAQNSVSILYRASITQSTGEDWSDVDLTLSTATPNLSSEIPQLTPHRIALPKVEKETEVGRKTRRRKHPMSSARFLDLEAEIDEDEEESDEDMGVACFIEDPGSVGGRDRDRDRDRERKQRNIATLAGPMRAVAAISNEGVTISTFVVQGKSTIPSDKDPKQPTQHKVTISQFGLDPKLDWIAVPKERTSVFLRCQMKNTTPYVLLPGPSSVFMDNNFICKSEIPHVSPQETFTISLGVDPSLRVTYHPLSKKSKTATGGFLQSKTETTTYTQRITIKNTHLKNTEVKVKEHIPVSDSSEIKVALVEPALKETKAWLQVASASTKARWTPKDEEDEQLEARVVDGKARSSEAVPGENGLLEWTSDIGAGKSIDLTLTWEISLPQGRTWINV